MQIIMPIWNIFTAIFIFADILNKVALRSEQHIPCVYKLGLQ